MRKQQNALIKQSKSTLIMLLLGIIKDIHQMNQKNIRRQQFIQIEELKLIQIIKVVTRIKDIHQLDQQNMKKLYSIFKKLLNQTKITKLQQQVQRLHRKNSQNQINDLISIKIIIKYNLSSSLVIIHQFCLIILLVSFIYIYKMKVKQSSKNPPSAIKQLIEQAMETRLYILKKYGPTSLKYCDDDGNKFKITLAETMSCTCNQSHQHCVHTIHAMLKVFQVDPSSPILWQNSYSSYDITNILSGKYKPPSPKKEQRPKKPIFIQQQVQLQQEQPKINPEDLCPICQESLKCVEAIVCCSKQCKNYFHAKCMKVWVIQKQSSGKKELPCPMCRVDWGEQALTEIRVEERIFENAHRTHKRTCANCKCSPIIGSLFMCIQCPNYVVCEKCINNKQTRHPHQSFLSKVNHSDPYELKGNIGMANLWQLFQDNLNSNKGNDLMLIGTTLSKQSKCSICLNSKSRILKLLPCGHIADENCLKKMSDLCYVCPIDQQPQFPGLYHSLNKEQREGVMTEIQKWSLSLKEEQQNKLPPLQKTSQLRQNQRSSIINIKRSGSSSVKRMAGDFLTVKQLSGNKNQMGPQQHFL